MSKPSRRKCKPSPGLVGTIAPPMEAGLPDVPHYEPGLDYAEFNALRGRVSELEGDLIRIVELIVMGDIDSAKFRDILTKRQGKR